MVLILFALGGNIMLKKNGIFIIVYLFLFMLMFFTIFNHLGLFRPLLNYIFNYEEWQITNAVTDYVFHGNGVFSYFEFLTEISPLEYDYMLIFGTQYMQLLPPIFAMISGIYILRVTKKTMLMEICRYNNYKFYIIKKITISSLKTAICVFLAYLSYFLFCYLISSGKLFSTDQVLRTFLIDIFGVNFYLKNTFIYYLVEGFIRFFVITFVYSFITSTAVMFFEKEKYALLIAPIWYYGLSVIFYVLQTFIGTIAIYFNPSTIMATGDYIEINSYLLILLSLFPFFISIGYIMRKTKYVEI